MFIWGFPFPDNHPSQSLDLPEWFGAGKRTVKTANKEREGVMDTATDATGDVPKEAAGDWERGCVGMLQHQSICWQWPLG